MKPKVPRIAVFSLAYAPFEGGAEIALKEIMYRLPNFAFTVFTKRFYADSPAQEVHGNVCIVRTGRGGTKGQEYNSSFSKIIYIFHAVFAARKIHAQGPFDAIWSIMAAYAGAAALLMKRRTRLPFLLTLQEGDSEAHIKKRVGFLYPLWQKIFRSADHIQTISTYLKDFAVRHGATCPVSVVPNGVAIEKFISHSDHASEPIIITTSRLVPKNGVDVLVHAFALVLQAHSDAQLHIVGGGPEETTLKNLARDLKIDSHVIFYGQVSPERIPELLSEATVFVRASRSEGLGNSFLEAMAGGVPIVGTAVGGITDFLKNEVTGLLVPPDDAPAVASAIERVLGDPTLAEQLTREAHTAIAGYTWDAIAGRMKDIINSLL